MKKKTLLYTSSLFLFLALSINAKSELLSTDPVQLKDFNNVWTLSSFNNSGVPSIMETSDKITDDLKYKINATLPEKYNIPKQSPQFLADPSKSNIKLIEPCELWVTFISEGADYRNTLGYFYYPTNSAPTSVNAINKRIVVFPNASFLNSGGSLSEGNKVRLKYFDDATKTWSNVFPKGITISWFLISNGFKRSKVTDGNYWLYSIPEFNDASVKPQQSLILYDKTEEKLILGFEDIMRLPNYKSDEDFNDALFHITVNPLEAIQTDGLNMLVDPRDQDNDGVPDAEDEYKNDPDKAFNNYYPGYGQWGSLAFEDLWPSIGDYDFNDFVSDYNFNTITNAQNKVAEITVNFKVRAAGATLCNGFAFQLETAADNVLSVTGSMNLSNRFTLNANGTEANQTKAVIPVVDDIIKLFGSDMVNTTIGGFTTEEKNISLTIRLKTPVSASELGTAPFNPFLIVNFNNERGREVHLATMKPTDLADTSYFGKGNDRTDVAKGIYYVATENFPWALNFPVSFDYPIEDYRIDYAYHKFNNWVTSLGLSFSDWFFDKIDYRNNEYIYKK